MISRRPKNQIQTARGAVWAALLLAAASSGAETAAIPSGHARFALAACVDATPAASDDPKTLMDGLREHGLVDARRHAHDWGLRTPVAGGAPSFGATRCATTRSADRHFMGPSERL